MPAILAGLCLIVADNVPTLPIDDGKARFCLAMVRLSVVRAGLHGARQDTINSKSLREFLDRGHPRTLPTSLMSSMKIPESSQGDMFSGCVPFVLIPKSGHWLSALKHPKDCVLPRST
jgi:hypothetical protein